MPTKATAANSILEVNCWKMNSGTCTYQRRVLEKLSVSGNIDRLYFVTYCKHAGNCTVCLVRSTSRIKSSSSVKCCLPLCYLSAAFFHPFCFLSSAFSLLLPPTFSIPPPAFSLPPPASSLLAPTFSFLSPASSLLLECLYQQTTYSSYGTRLRCSDHITSRSAYQRHICSTD